MFWKCFTTWTVPGRFCIASIWSDTAVRRCQNFRSVLMEGQVLGKLERAGSTLTHRRWWKKIKSWKEKNPLEDAAQLGKETARNALWKQRVGGAGPGDSQAGKLVWTYMTGHSIYKQAQKSKAVPWRLDQALLSSMLSQNLCLLVRALASICKGLFISGGQCHSLVWVLGLKTHWKQGVPLGFGIWWYFQVITSLVSGTFSHGIHVTPRSTSQNCLYSVFTAMFKAQAILMTLDSILYDTELSFWRARNASCQWTMQT